MGLTYVKGTVQGVRGRKKNLRFLVDSGASYTLLPLQVWKYLKLKPSRQAEFVLADGTKITRGISECLLTLKEGCGHTPVILGEKGDEPLLGIITLENLGLVLDPFKRILIGMQLRIS